MLVGTPKADTVPYESERVLHRPIKTYLQSFPDLGIDGLVILDPKDVRSVRRQLERESSGRRFLQVVRIGDGQLLEHRHRRV